VCAQLTLIEKVMSTKLWNELNTALFSRRVRILNDLESKTAFSACHCLILCGPLSFVHLSRETFLPTMRPGLISVFAILLQKTPGWFSGWQYFCEIHTPVPHFFQSHGPGLEEQPSCCWLRIDVRCAAFIIQASNRMSSGKLQFTLG